MIGLTSCTLDGADPFQKAVVEGAGVADKGNSASQAGIAVSA